ncbi:MAG TPA: SGNH/GDSL hydrolase family protein [Solirubrobacteraceae bacterium]|nr:SGNH/GDSL hydrolase family protein [Solirubrobacteraceae bacterium]
MRRISLALAVLSLALLLAAQSALAAKRAHAKQSHYYLALGDSLSVGFQPLANPGLETNQGYTNDLRAHYARQVKRLKLVDLGCPGDTTGSLLSGQGNDASAMLYHCPRTGGSQLAAAVKFLRAHHRRGEVPLVTIDIGANDVDGCVNEPSFAQIIACVGAGEQAIKTNTPKILSALRRAAPKGTKFAAMNLYDPVLAFELSSSSQERSLGTASLALVSSINSDIGAADRAVRFKTADVAGAFGTYETRPISYGSQSVGADVVKICQLTWMCTSPPIGPNIHANATGYSVIAGAFESVIGKLK